MSATLKANKASPTHMKAYLAAKMMNMSQVLKQSKSVPKNDCEIESTNNIGSASNASNHYN